MRGWRAGGPEEQQWEGGRQGRQAAIDQRAAGSRLAPQLSQGDLHCFTAQRLRLASAHAPFMSTELQSAA